MNRPKLQLSRLIDNDLIRSGKTIHINMVENAATFPGTAADLAALEDDVDDFDAAVRAVNFIKLTVLQLLASRATTRRKLEARLRKLGTKVQEVALDNPAAIRIAGMAVTNDPQPIHMTQVLNLKLKPSDRDAELLAAWKPVRGARYYRVQVCIEAVPGNWIDHLTTTKSKCALNHTLVSGTKVFVRVCAAGTKGDGAWSDIGWKTVP